MKENEKVNYKVRLWMDEEGELQGLSFFNQKIPIGLFNALNDAMHEVVNSFNGKNAWKENYIKFTERGKRYEQFDGKDAKNPCNDCVFHIPYNHCQHPYYFYGSKGYCGKPYREVKETKKYDEDYLNSLIAKAKKSWKGVDADSYMSDLRDEEGQKATEEQICQR